MIAKLYERLRQMPGSCTIEELARELRVSKTAIRRGLAQLESEGCIAIAREES
jgi:predicted ArsR family transcriptional regulator